MGTELADNLLRVSDYRKAELAEIKHIREGLITPNLSWNRFFWHSEYATHQRAGYFASVRMHSSRNHTMEQPHNEEGLKMHHVGDGSNFVSLTGQEYLDIFPVWNWQKIPGTTTVQKPVHPHWKDIAKKGLTDFVGGVSDGNYGAVAMDFQSAHDPLKARKSWFFFDDEYVCLGAAITSTAETPVFTTLNQCLLDTAVIAKSKKDQVTLDKGEHKLDNVNWVLHAGVGYAFPEARDIHISNKVARGNWRDINHQTHASSQDVSMEVFSLWIDHGVKPQDASYEYVVVPGAKASDMESYEKSSPVEILVNKPEVQAVRHRKLNRTQIIFYRAGKVKMYDDITLEADQPSMILVKANDKGIEQITVSDPTHKLTALRLRISGMIEGAGENWESTYNKKEKESLMDIVLPSDGYAGQSVVINLTKF